MNPFAVRDSDPKWFKDAVAYTDKENMWESYYNLSSRSEEEIEYVNDDLIGVGFVFRPFAHIPLYNPITRSHVELVTYKCGTQIMVVEVYNFMSLWYSCWQLVEYDAFHGLVCGKEVGVYCEGWIRGKKFGAYCHCDKHEPSRSFGDCTPISRGEVYVDED